MPELNSDLDITKTIIYWLPITSLLLLIYGLLKITFFYSLFGVNILLFLDIGEIIPLILRDFIISISAAIFGYSLGFLFPNKQMQEKAIENLKLSSIQAKTTNRMYYYFKSHPFLWIFFISLTLTLFIPIFKRNFDVVNFWRLIFLCIVPITCFVLPLEIIHLLKLNRNISLNSNSKIFIFFLQC